MKKRHSGPLMEDEAEPGLIFYLLHMGCHGLATAIVSDVADRRVGRCDRSTVNIGHILVWALVMAGASTFAINTAHETVTKPDKVSKMGPRSSCSLLLSRPFSGLSIIRHHSRCVDDRAITPRRALAESYGPSDPRESPAPWERSLRIESKAKPSRKAIRNGHLKMK